MWIAKALNILTPKAGFSVYEDNINKIEWFSEDIERPSNDAILSNVSELKLAEPVRILRLQRDRLLAESDWRDLPSYPGSNQESWRTYRQALRDLPSDTEDTSNPTWPTAPETD